MTIISAIIWDIDGTLIDSEPLHLRALLETCAAYNVDLSGLPDDEFVGVNLHDVWKAIKNRLPVTLSRDKWIAELNHYYRANSQLLTPMPQAVEVVTGLSKCGIIQAAVSNSNRAIVETNLEVSKLKTYMQFSLSLDDVPVGKPSPVPYLKAISILGLMAEEIIAVEDSLSGAQSAAAAGLTVLGFMMKEKQGFSAVHRINNLTETFDYLDCREPFEA